MSEKKEPKLIKTKWGFYQYHPLPSDEELEQYYAQTYYQQGMGSYEVSYTDEEKKWFGLRSWMLFEKAQKLCDGKGKKYIDVGCGEGWLLKEFFSNGYAVTGLDFSSEGIRKFHSELLPFLTQGNVYGLLADIIEKGKKYDIVSLANVIEHVKFPHDLLNNIKKIMAKESLLVIVAPNDFSELHNHLEEKKFITKQWWLKYPDHLSYFNKGSMGNLLNDLGYEVRSVVGDHPIDLNLLNDNSNYDRDESKGPNTHQYRIRQDNFLAAIDRQKLLQIYEILGSMGVGRNLIYYCTLK